jgi:hypothetical protein
MRDLTGLQVGRLTVIGYEGKANKGHYWNCSCECGATKPILGERLTARRTKSCGCLQKEIARSAHKLRPYESVYNVLVNSATYFAKGVTLTYEQFLSLVELGKCHYCGDAITWTQHGLKKNNAGYNVDRIDSSLGYTVENCVPCCWACNRMKCNIPYQEFLDRVKKIAANHRRE